jgi:hypothetical protein
VSEPAAFTVDWGAPVIIAFSEAQVTYACHTLAVGDVRAPTKTPPAPSPALMVTNSTPRDVYGLKLGKKTKEAFP